MNFIQLSQLFSTTKYKEHNTVKYKSKIQNEQKMQIATKQANY